MNKHIVLGFIAGLIVSLIVYVIAPFVYSTSSTKGGEELGGQIVLTRINQKGVSKETGLRIPYDITGTYPGVSAVVLSLDKERVVYTTWENARIMIHVSDIQGANSKVIAEQEVPEGSGGLDVGTIKWSDDGKTITYTESGMTCKGTCTQPSEEVSVRTWYSVDVQTGKKIITQTE
jgi:hypothetical protein